MSNPTVGYRFRPTDVEIVDHYLRLKNLGDGFTSDVDEVISTVNICRFNPWDLPSKSKTESLDMVWYFFGLKDNKYNRGERQSRKTSSGFWKKTGVTTNIMRKRGGNREKIGEKRVLVFHFSKQSKSKWVMHEYTATFLSSNDMMETYTICKVSFKGDAREMSSYPGSEVEHSNRSLTAHVKNSSRSEGSPVKIQELQNPCQSTGAIGLDADSNNPNEIDCESFPVDDDDEQSKTVNMQEHCNDHIPLEISHKNNTLGVEGTPFKSQNQDLQNPNQFTGFPGLDADYHNQPSDDWSLLSDGDELSKIFLMQEDCNDHISEKTLTGVFIGHSSDGYQTVGQGNEIEEHKIGQETINNE